MRELEAIIAAHDQCKLHQTDCILATVVHVAGSSYRKAGARMLIDETGMMTGAISGGCLEGDALRKALHALHLGRNKLVTYDTSDENDAIIGAQLGCNGVIQVLFEPIDYQKENNPIELLRTLASSKQPMVAVSLFDLDRSKEQTGTVFTFHKNDFESTYHPKDILTTEMAEEIQMVFELQHDHFSQYLFNNQVQSAFLEYSSPPVNLVLVGAGNDAQILSRMADELGWNVFVTDGRPTHASESRFVSSCQVIVSEPERILQEVPISEQSVFVLISHNYQYDLAVLKAIYDKEEIPYIGILGPRKKYLRMLDDLKAEGIEFSSDQSNRIYAPVGLNLNAETPAEISLAILSEIQMVLTQSTGQSLRDKKGPIHEKLTTEFKPVIS